MNIEERAEEQFIIQGLAKPGGKQKYLSGSIPVRGAKNAALKAAAATLLFRDAVELKNVPEIEDMHRSYDILEALGAAVEPVRARQYRIAHAKSPESVLPADIANKFRASIVFTGPVLARTSRVRFTHPGGCLIGARPIDLFLEGFQAMGARVRERDGEYTITAPPRGLKGASIFFRTPSVTATETLMMTAVLARGTTTLRNAAREPEIPALAEFLNVCGAHISGAGTPTITIHGGGLLNAGNNAFVTPPDRIEAGSFLVLGALAGRDLRITRCEPNHLTALITVLRDAGVSIFEEKKALRVSVPQKKGTLHSIPIKTSEYPGFPTDLQAPFTVFLTQTAGKALVFEAIFEGRFRYVDALQKMGADVTPCDPHRIIVRGPTVLSGRTLESPDLRAGLAYIIAAAVARGTSVIHNVYTIDRGYEQIEERLQKIGLDIKRTSTEQ